MTVVLDYKVIDIHVHIMPWEMLNPAAAAAVKATQSNHALLHELCGEPAAYPLPPLGNDEIERLETHTRRQRDAAQQEENTCD